MRQRFGLVILLVTALLVQMSVMAMPKSCHSSGDMLADTAVSPEIPCHDDAASVTTSPMDDMTSMTPTQDCCGEVGIQCTMGVCLFVAIPSTPSGPMNTGSPVLTAFQPFSVSPTPITFLFRPPIA